MVPEPTMLEVDATAQDAGRCFAENDDVRAVFVVEHDHRLVGVLTRKTLVREGVAPGRPPRDVPLGGGARRAHAARYPAGGDCGAAAAHARRIALARRGLSAARGERPRARPGRRGRRPSRWRAVARGRAAPPGRGRAAGARPGPGLARPLSFGSREAETRAAWGTTPHHPS